MAADPSSGHRLHPHTADVIVEAWGPDDLACAQEAARALIELCISGEPDPEAGLRVSRVSATGSDLVPTVLDEVVFALDTSELAPVSVEVERDVDSAVTLRFGLAQRGTVRLTGAAPKAIVMLAQESVGADGRSRCRFIVDV